jgi:hypothetical protein
MGLKKFVVDRFVDVLFGRILQYPCTLEICTATELQALNFIIIIF